MFWSKNYFFKQKPFHLKYYREQVVAYLEIKRFKIFEVNMFLEAYDYFVDHPDKFDGATIVKDLDDLPNLSLSSLRHDFEYLIELPKCNGFWNWLKTKIKSDFRYAKNLERFGKGVFTPYLRFLALVLTTPLYILITALKKQKKIWKKKI